MNDTKKDQHWRAEAELPSPTNSDYTKASLTGFVWCLMLFIFLNLAPYFLLSTENHHEIGFPRYFWRSTKSETTFRSVVFLVDSGLALFFSYKAGAWWATRCWQKANCERMSPDHPRRKP